MLQVKLEVNGVLIDYIDIVNVGKVAGDLCTYDVSYKGKNVPVTHNRGAGAVVLALQAIQSLNAAGAFYKKKGEQKDE